MSAAAKPSWWELEVSALLKSWKYRYFENCFDQGGGYLAKLLVKSLGEEKKLVCSLQRCNMASLKWKLDFIDKLDILLVSGYLRLLQPEDQYKCSPQEITDLCTLYMHDDGGISELQIDSHMHLGAIKGRVRYIGTTEFSKDEPVLGIELDEWSANATDGSIQGIRYFDAEPGMGFFMRKQSYMDLADMINASYFADNSPCNEILRRDPVTIHDTSSILPIEYTVGDRVRLENGDTGVIS